MWKGEHCRASPGIVSAAGRFARLGGVVLQEGRGAVYRKRQRIGDAPRGSGFGKAFSLSWAFRTNNALQRDAGTAWRFRRG